jgi:hypothetical protein
MIERQPVTSGSRSTGRREENCRRLSWLAATLACTFRQLSASAKGAGPLPTNFIPGKGLIVPPLPLRDAATATPEDLSAAIPRLLGWKH